ncbi:Trypanosome variant surface glycoprotein C-terminal domain containing protein, putative [Trypanosoma equiperdum]|uniref:Trypanosome variant surface glycoprotein C-terminal domain containing protein, putative n=1 Tax=Trypanosoma equiperdum TaxID=5694 RepID=A0A1G4HY40_TRYEQ|nr:Trypanosome variant surface glycoprotein C-terminal domain containing protein, putative [Trypanosoma equiperdum]
MVEKIFKAGEGNYPEKLHKEAETKPLSKTLAKGTTAANLAELENAIDLQIAQIYYTQRMADGFTAKLKEAEEQLSKAKLGDYGAAAAEAACNKLDGEQKCNADPKCTYNSTEPDKSKKCKYNATKAEKNCVHVAQTQTAGTETTTGNCKGKEKDECKSPDCKWEGETCKDSTILLSKQFALSMVSSAFVALLF